MLQVPGCALVAPLPDMVACTLKVCGQPYTRHTSRLTALMCGKVSHLQ